MFFTNIVVDMKQPEHIDAKELFDMLQVNLETRIKTFAKVVKTKQAFGSTSKSERNEIEDKNLGGKLNSIKSMFGKSGGKYRKNCKCCPLSLLIVR